MNIFYLIILGLFSSDYLNNQINNQQIKIIISCPIYLPHIFLKHLILIPIIPISYALFVYKASNWQFTGDFAFHLGSNEISIYVNILHSFLNLGDYRKDELLENAR